MGLSYISGVSNEELPFSDAVVAGDFIFISGMCGFGTDKEIVPGGVAQETQQIFNDLAVVLTRCHATFEQIVKVNVHLVNSSDFDKFNSVYANFFPRHKPARITVCSGMTINACVEMDFIAYTGD